MTICNCKKLTTSKPIMSTFDGSPVVVGRYDEKSRSFLNIVKASDRFRTHDAYGFDEPAVEELKKLGCLEIELQITGGNRYRIDFQTFLKQARRIDWTKRDKPRFPARLYVPMSFWQVVQDEPVVNEAEVPSECDALEIEEPVWKSLILENSLDFFSPAECKKDSLKRIKSAKWDCDIKTTNLGNRVWSANFLCIGWSLRATNCFDVETYKNGTRAFKWTEQDVTLGGPQNGYPAHFLARLECESCEGTFDAEVPFFGVCPVCGASTKELFILDILNAVCVSAKTPFKVVKKLIPEALSPDLASETPIEKITILAVERKEGVAA
jgi:hypothetical protein